MIYNCIKKGGKKEKETNETMIIPLGMNNMQYNESAINPHFIEAINVTKVFFLVRRGNLSFSKSL